MNNDTNQFVWYEWMNIEIVKAILVYFAVYLRYKTENYDLLIIVNISSYLSMI